MQPEYSFRFAKLSVWHRSDGHSRAVQYVADQTKRVWSEPNVRGLTGQEAVGVERSQAIGCSGSAEQAQLRAFGREDRYQLTGDIKTSHDRHCARLSRGCPHGKRR
ncbi:MAG: hypothetical protein AAFY64_04125 [Pseudomonadota bacterium]